MITEDGGKTLVSIMGLSNEVQLVYKEKGSLTVGTVGT